MFPARGGRRVIRCVAAAAVLIVLSCGASRDEPRSVAWHLAALHADPFRQSGLGDGVVVAFIDSGLTATALPRLASRSVVGVNEVVGENGLSDPNGHGTAMAVIAAGGGDDGVWGVAPAAEVLPVLAVDGEGHGSPAAVSAGIRWASAHGAAIINISLASAAPSQEVADAIRAASAGGILVVVAAGDLGLPGPEFPASVPGAIAVYGEDESGKIGAHSNVPTGVGVLAPGERIETLVPSSTGVRKLVINGTSAAAALVSGLLAACLSSVIHRSLAFERRAGRCRQLLLSRSSGRFLNLNHMMEA